MDQSTAKKTIFNFGMVLGLQLFLEKNAKELHVGLLNILLLAGKNSFEYCFCNYYQGCEWRTGRRTYCPLCKLAYDSYEFEKRCDYGQFNFDALYQIAMETLPYLEECFEVGDSDRILELFDDEYNSYTRESYNGSKLTTTLRERIQYDTEIKELNGEKNYLKFLYE